MKCSLSILLMIFSIKVGVAQTDTVRFTTAKQVYTRFINVIGGEDRLKSVFAMQYGQVNYDSANQIMYKGIQADDMHTFQQGKVYYVYSPSKVDMCKQIITNGKSYSFVNEKKTAEYSIPQEKLVSESIFSDLFIRWSEGELLPMEIINGEEAYVIEYYSKNTSGNLYDYFSKSTGLLIARKIIGPVSNGKSIIRYSFFSDYRSVGGIMFCYKEKTFCKDLTQNSCFTIVMHDVSFNMDFDYFKNVIFKNPKKALDKIPN